MTPTDTVLDDCCDSPEDIPEVVRAFAQLPDPFWGDFWLVSPRDADAVAAALASAGLRFDRSLTNDTCVHKHTLVKFRRVESWLH